MAKRREGRVEKALLGPLLKGHPRLLKVLDKHGVTFCAGCYLTLQSPLKRVAGYHAVADVKRFMKEVERAVSARR